MKKIDAHAHVFETVAGFTRKGEFRPIGKGVCRWSNGDEMTVIPEGYGETDFLAESFLRIMEEHEVEKAILLQGSLYGYQNEYGLRTAEKYPEKFKAAITADPFCKDAVQILERYIALGVKIFKFEVSVGAGLMGYHQDFLIDDEIMDKFYRRIAEIEGATLVLDIGSPSMRSCQPQGVYRIAKKYPKLNIVICHLLAPSNSDEDKRLVAYALPYLTHENVWVDLSALPWNVAPETYPYPSALDYIQLAKDQLGTKKILWGTDTPAVLTKDSYGNIANYIVESELFDEEELNQVFYTNAKRAYYLD